MFHTLANNIYCIELPLPHTPLKSLNSVVIKGKERNLIIDTGLNHDDCFKAMNDGLDALEIDRGKTDFFITHFHADHIALLPRLLTKTSNIYFNRPDSDILGSLGDWESYIELARINGFPEDGIRSALLNHPGYKYKITQLPAMQLIDDNEIITVGEYNLQCISTPGHTPGHICLYESKNKIFISGDHILGDISPNIQGWEDNSVALADYFRSLDKVYPLDVELVVPGHRSLFSDFKGRIRELKTHHHERLDEVLNIVSKSKNPHGLNAYETASQMRWDIRAKSWEDFPIAQKWFATGEALAHLHYLEQQNKIVEQNINNRLFYSMNI